jgi:hypothetical protein
MAYLISPHLQPPRISGVAIGQPDQGRLTVRLKGSKRKLTSSARGA